MIRDRGVPIVTAKAGVDNLGQRWSAVAPLRMHLEIVVIIA
jgi:hypothetical protein